MPIEPYPQTGYEPPDEDAPIWRYMPLNRFGDLMTSSQLYFCRADLFEDENEGLPTEDYARSVCANMKANIDNVIGDLVQQKEGYYISCWHLFDHETARMWRKYAEAGVAICSRYRLLKVALDAMPERAMLGLVRYGFDHVGWNILRFITTKRPDFKHEREVRALIWKPEWAGRNRHIDLDNNFHRRPITPPPPYILRGLRQTVDLQAVIKSIVVSPTASADMIIEVESLVKSSGYSIPVSQSIFTQYRHLLPDLDEIIRFSTD